MTKSKPVSKKQDKVTRETAKNKANADTLILIKEKDAENTLSPAQKKFNSLVKQIEKQKTILAEWQEAQDFCQHKALNELLPALRKLAKHKADMALLMHHHMENHSFSKNQKEKIINLIIDLAEESLSTEDNQKLKEVYNYYANTDYDMAISENKQMAVEKIREILKKELNIEVPDDTDLSDIESLERLFDKLEKDFAESEEAEKAAKPQRKKTARQKAKEMQQEEDEKNTSKSIQAIYRELVTGLHPDREQDLEEKHRKTELMKQVTVAYRKKDLLKLLELQIKMEKIDQEKINNIAEDRLKHYNIVLKKQLESIKMECLFIEENLILKSGYELYKKARPKDIKKIILDDIREVEYLVEEILNDLSNFKDVGLFKKWINSLKNKQLTSDFF